MRRALATALTVLAALAVAPAVPAQAAADPTRVRQCTESALRAAVDAVPAGGTVTFGCDGTITLTSAGGSTVEIHKSLTIDGRGHDVTISGGGLVSLFFASNLADFTLRHLTLADGSSQDVGLVGGGAVYNANAHLTADDVTFRGNHAFNYGGAIYSTGTFASTTVRRSRFVDNVVTCPITGQGGGAIAMNSGGPLAVADSTFARNASVGVGAGGAILASRTYNPALDGAVTIARSRFTGNATRIDAPSAHDTPQGGGAVAIFNHAVTITGSTFVDNRTTTVVGASVGGAVLLWGDPFGPLAAQPARVADSTFRANLAQHDTDFSFGLGGAVGVLGVDASLTGDAFHANGAAQGGALYNTGTLRLGASLLDANSASGFAAQPPYAGALFNVGRAVLDRDVFLRNRDVACASPSGTIEVSTGIVEMPGTSCRARRAAPARS